MRIHRKSKNINIFDKKSVTVMMTGELVGYSFMGAKKLIQDSDLTVGVIKDRVTDKDKTLNAAEKAGFDYVTEPEESGKISCIIKEVKGIKIGIINVDREHLEDEETLKNRFSEARKDGAEFLLVYAGFGAEIDDMDLKKLVEAGADYIIGYGKKKVGPYSVLISGENKQVPIIYSSGTFGGRQGKIIIAELRLSRNKQGDVELISEGYHPCLGTGKIRPIDEALNEYSDNEERIELENALLTIRTSMGINERCKCIISADKMPEKMMNGSYSPLQKQYEVQPLITARRKQTAGAKRVKKAAEREATIILTGNIEYDSRIEEEAECFGHYEFRKSFKAISRCFKDADFVIGSLDTMASPNYPGISEVSKRSIDSGYSNCRMEFIEALEQAGFTGIAVSNPHNAYLGIEGILDTEQTIKDHNMIPSGLGYDKTPTVDVNDMKVALVSVTVGCAALKNRLTEEASDRFLNIFDMKKTKAEIDRAKADDADFVIAYINCGADDGDMDIEARKKAAESVADMGADYVICTGSREVSEHYRFDTKDGRNVPIATSLGCFITGNEDIPSHDGSMIKLRLLRDFEGKIHISDSFIPIKIYHKYDGVCHNIVPDDAYYNDDSVEYGRNFTVAELYGFLGKTPDEKDLEKLGEKYHEQVSFITAKEEYIEEGCAAVLFKYADYGRFEEREWDIRKCVEAGVTLVIDNVPHDELPCIVVEDDLMDVYGKLIKEVIKGYDPITLAITGTMGKTTTKDMAVSVFDNYYKTLSKRGNVNTAFTVGLLAQKLREDDEAYVQEVNGGTIGEASHITKMIEPDICILTNIEKNHMSQVGTVENLIKAKMGIIDGLKPDGVLIMCRDNKYLHDMEPPVKTISYSISDPSCHYYGRNIRTEGDDLLFDIVVNRSEFDDAGVYPARLNIRGEHNVGNAIAVFAAARRAGIPPHEIIAGLSRFKTRGIRQNIFEHDGIRMIMDTYNSNPVALYNMIDVLDQFKPEENGRKIIILGMMGEQGDDSQQVHYDVGKTVGGREFDVLFCFGEDAKYMAKGARDCGKEAYWFDNREAFNRSLANSIRPGDVVLVKGSHSNKLDTATMVQIFGKGIRSR